MREKDEVQLMGVILVGSKVEESNSHHRKVEGGSGSGERKKKAALSAEQGEWKPASIIWGTREKTWGRMLVTKNHGGICVRKSKQEKILAQTISYCRQRDCDDEN